MCELVCVVDEACFIDGAAHEQAGPLVAGEGRCTTEQKEVDGILVNAEGAAVVHVQGAYKDGTGQVVEGGGPFNVGRDAGVR